MSFEAISLRGARAGWCLVAVALVLSAGPVKSQSAAPIGPTGERTWTAFSADYTITSTKTGETVTTGRFHRDRQGSSRDEKAAPKVFREQVGDPGLTWVSIANAAENMAYYRVVTTRWCSVPIPADMGQHQFDPSRRPAEHQLELEGVRDGLTIYRQTAGAPRDSTWVAAELNFFRIREIGGGEDKRYRNIDRRDQPSDLFIPPPGSAIVRLASFSELPGCQ